MAQAPASSTAGMLDEHSVARLLAGERVPRPSGCSDELLPQLGLAGDADNVWLLPGFEPLSQERVNGGLSARARQLWPDFELNRLSSSTNAQLMALGGSAQGRWLATEFQDGGRGRRGRTWVSPVGRNIAVSFGWSQPGTLATMSGLSLVAGIAVVDALRTLGLETVALKWPNDVIVVTAGGGYAKLGGILVELQQLPGSALAVIGIGLNLGSTGLLDAAVDQAMIDIAGLNAEVGRNQVLSQLVNTLADYLAEFEGQGFAPMVDLFDSLHAFTGREVDVLSAEQRLGGVVLGVAVSGELRLGTADGQELRVDAGEVSLRQRTDDRVNQHADTAVLEIDLGNSAMKYRCGDIRGRVPHEPIMSAGLPDLKTVSRVRVASVLSSAQDQAFAAEVRDRWGCDCEFARSSAELAGVTNGYDQPETLGVDRWLAAVAGYHHVGGPVLVVDLGTAVTLDYVDGLGAHLGGYIVPGSQLMCRALLQETAAVRFAEADLVVKLQPGRQTRDAVERGALLALVQLIAGELERFNEVCDPGARLVLCGGGAEAVARHLDCSFELVPELVLDGLALALP